MAGVAMRRTMRRAPGRVNAGRINSNPAGSVTSSIHPMDPILASVNLVSISGRRSAYEEGNVGMPPVPDMVDLGDSPWHEVRHWSGRGRPRGWKLIERPKHMPHYALRAECRQRNATTIRLLKRE